MSDLDNAEVVPWPEHVLHVGNYRPDLSSDPEPEEHRNHVEPWLSALFQAEHLNLLIGSGFTTAIARVAGASTAGMEPEPFGSLKLADAVNAAAQESAKRLSRGDPNIEDQIRSIIDLIAGLQILAKETGHGDGDRLLCESAEGLLDNWKSKLNDILNSFIKKILETERGLLQAVEDADEHERANRVRRLLAGFLLAFASRTSTRERLHIFTTNYDRLIEYGCDLLGLRIIDRFVGTLAPVFRSSRLGIDMHYNPPGIRGEPRYLEGVVRLTKLHGSLDWRSRIGPSGGVEVQRCALPFGIPEKYLLAEEGNSVLIYPNPAKDVETLEYPYAELFRDFAAAVCRPNAVVVTYGYGFGDDHVNRILADMLSVPSTHLVIISWDDAGGRLQRFYKRVGRDEQITLLVGKHFGDLETLIQHYLPKPAIDRTTWRMVELLQRRTRPTNNGEKCPGAGENSSLEAGE